MKNYEDFYDDNICDYEEEKEKAFVEHINIMLSTFVAKTDSSDMDADNFRDWIEEFEFPSIDEWMTDTYEAMRDMYDDAKYEQYRDERAGL